MSTGTSRSDVATTSPARPSRLRRFSLIFGIFVLACVAIALAGSAYTRSHHFAALVADRLGEFFPGNLRIDTIDIGWNETILRDLSLHEDENSTTPWVVVKKIETRLPPSRLIDDTPRPDYVRIEDTSATLRFDAKNHLTTRLPLRKGPFPAIPEIDVANLEVTIDQEGRSPFTVHHLNGTAHTEEGRLLFSGTAEDPVWGKWSVKASVDPATAVSQLTLESANAKITQEMLNSLPFVSPKVWQHVQCSGISSATVTVRKAPDSAKPHYRVELHPVETHVHITSAHLDADDAAGDVVCEDGLVTLNKIQGKVADGQIDMSGSLNFRQPEYSHSFAVTAKRMNLSKLPAQWRIPNELGGRLSGHADLKVMLVKGKPQTSGEGEGTIEYATFAGVPMLRPIRIRLHADDGGFRFNPILAGIKLPGPKLKPKSSSPEK